VDLETALEQFDVVEANLLRLKKVFYEMSKIIPRSRSAVIDDEADAQRYRELQRSWQAITRALPPIGSYQIESSPISLDALARARMEAEEVAQSRFESVVSFGTGLDEPWQEIQEYEARLRQARRDLVREHLIRLISEIDPLVKVLAARVQPDRQRITDEDWGKLVEALRQVERLTGGMVPRGARWQDMRRHLSIGQGVDLHDIARLDWPSVRAELQENLYSELEPLPVQVSNIASLVQAKPSGPVTTKLNWEAITAEDFERLLFNLMADAGGYANPQMLMRTNAPDRGRDISVERVISDTLSGTRNQRVIIQAKHWLSRSVGAADVADALAQMALWEPPRIQVLIFATSGRFTADAVAWVEKHNDSGKQPTIEMWPDSHLELLLAQRPYLAAGYNLR
jgi:hypothetical protein